MGKPCGRLEPSHLKNAIRKAIILLRISIKESNRVKPTIREEISREKVVTTTLNSLHQTNWPHLLENAHE